MVNPTRIIYLIEDNITIYIEVVNSVCFFVCHSQTNAVNVRSGLIIRA